PTRPDVASPAQTQSTTSTQVSLVRRRTRFGPSTSGGPEPIAIIGVSGCFPQARDIDALWANLAAGRDCISQIPNTRWENETNIKHAGLIDGVDEFDPLFFGISPGEAQAMDPQQRL